MYSNWITVSCNQFSVLCRFVWTDRFIFFSLRVRWQQLPMMSRLIFHSPWWCFKVSWSLSVERRKSAQRWVFIQAETDWARQNSGNDSNDRSKLSSENYEMAKNQSQMRSFKTIRDWGCRKYPRFLCFLIRKILSPSTTIAWYWSSFDLFLSKFFFPFYCPL